MNWAMLAKIDLDFAGHGPLPGSRPPSQVLVGAVVVIAAALVLTCAVVLWAVFIRKPREVRQPGPRLPHSSPTVTETDDGRLRVRKKHRRRRRDHRGRNPTLAETGGLSEGSNPSPPSAS